MAFIAWASALSEIWLLAYEAEEVHGPDEESASSHAEAFRSSCDASLLVFETHFVSLPSRSAFGEPEAFAAAYWHTAVLGKLSLSMLFTSTVAAAALSLFGGSLYSSFWRTPTDDPDVERWSCRPFLPNVFAEAPPSPAHPAIRRAVHAVDEFFTARFAEGDIDSLSVAVVTSQGALYERNFGNMRANESQSPETTSHSMYRMASVSKLFAALEGFILEEKGALSW